MEAEIFQVERMQSISELTTELEEILQTFSHFQD